MDDREAHEFYADPAHRELKGAPRKREGRRLTAMSSVRFDPGVIETVKDIAFREGITVGSWIRRLVQREIEQPEAAEIVTEDGPVRVPADAMRQILSALMPFLIRHGSIDLHIGPLYVEQGGVPVLAGAAAAPARPAGIIAGAGRKGQPETLPSSLQFRPRTFTCPHMSVGNVVSVTCETCGPLEGAA